LLTSAGGVVGECCGWAAGHLSVADRLEQGVFNEGVEGLWADRQADPHLWQNVVQAVEETVNAYPSRLVAPAPSPADDAGRQE
jgi:hypothetical protein